MRINERSRNVHIAGFILAAVSHGIDAGDEKIISCVEEIWDRRFDPGSVIAQLEKWLGRMILLVWLSMQ